MNNCMHVYLSITHSHACGKRKKLRIKDWKNFFVHKLKLKVMKIRVRIVQKKKFKLTDFVKIDVLHVTTIISSDVVHFLFH